MREVVNVAWGVSVAVAIVSGLMFIGSWLPKAYPYFGYVTVGATAIVFIGMVVFEIESRAFDRGVKSAEETAQKKLEDPR